MSTPRDGHDETDAAGGRVPDDAAVAGQASEAQAPEVPAPEADAAPDEQLQPTAVLEPLSADHQPTEVIHDGAVAAAAPAAAVPAAVGADASAGAGSADAAASGATPERRRTGRGWIIAGAIVLAVAALLVVADLVTRSIIEQRIAAEAEAAFPEQVQGDVDVEIGGFSVLAQLLTGSIGQITADAPDLQVEGSPIAVHLVAHGVPVQQDGTVDFVEGSVTADAASLNALIDTPGVDGEITLGDGVVGYQGQIQLLGIEVDYSVTAEAEAAGTSVLLTPVGVEFGSGDRTLALDDLPGLLRNPLDVCVAKYLPQGAEVSGIEITPDRAVVSFQARDLPLGEEALQVTGTCD
ncbi:Protein of unknown function [Agromyces sp. CF514]|uniref:LmeA family phospholipid-binding protein n=1 Tax=Agromyces sp. CF514 TaxID=1881031 RepID=UPI0008EF7AE0|nr:DUF2993 domain-containing protein [Agromyces sp. CF514]SFR87115.1 Protein of unknown function [Agromyces sp. CF514]